MQQHEHNSRALPVNGPSLTLLYRWSSDRRMSSRMLMFFDGGTSYRAGQFCLLVLVTNAGLCILTHEKRMA